MDRVVFSLSVVYPPNIVLMMERMPCRRYRSGFVWHDLSEDDLLVPAQGAEYVLKGSEIQLDQSTPGIN